MGMASITESLAEDAWADVKDLMGVCTDCQKTAEFGKNLYARHLYLAHLRGWPASDDKFDFDTTMIEFVA